MKSIEDQLKDYKKFNEAKNAFVSGLILGWAHQLEKANHDQQFRVIQDMKEFSDKLAKSAGVIIADDSNL
jgi:hypothetical protein